MSAFNFGTIEIEVMEGCGGDGPRYNKTISIFCNYFSLAGMAIGSLTRSISKIYHYNSREGSVIGMINSDGIAGIRPGCFQSTSCAGNSSTPKNPDAAHAYLVIYAHSIIKYAVENDLCFCI